MRRSTCVRVDILIDVLIPNRYTYDALDLSGNTTALGAYNSKALYSIEYTHKGVN